MLGAGWLMQMGQRIEEHLDVYITAAWGKALAAMPGGPDPASLNDKQRQVIKVRWCTLTLGFHS